ncbi:MAG: FHA domain-containing protein [Kiritimatiellae bacterium]|nr:FHA domain-containing protein [Kiritimatiellia bacterium]
MAFLEVTSPSELRGKRFTIDQDEVVIGRSHECDWQLTDSSVSSRHVSIRREGGKYTLRDLDSTNGTTVNGMSIRELRLNPKDVITLGAVELLFDGEDVEPDVRPATPGRTTVDTVRVASPDRREAVPSFELKKDRKVVWVVLGVVIGAAVAILAYRFITALRRGM